MPKRYSKEFLKVLRNEIPIAILISDLLKLENKVSEGYFRFLCPICSTFNTATSQKTNLARCFRCEKNFNPIDMVMEVKRVGFIDAVEYLNEIVSCRSKLKKMLADNELEFSLNLFESI
jgi:DNA primase